MKNNGKKYEEFVGDLYQALLYAQGLLGQNNIAVQRNIKIVDACGVEREFDLYWEYELAGITYKTVIECKDYNSKVSIEKIDALVGKVRDLPDLKPVFATKKGYQSGAISKAEHNRIDLLLVREQNDSDWQDDDGTPLVRMITLNMHMFSPADITDIKMYFDADWFKSNFDVNDDYQVSISGMNNEIFIESEDENERYSLRDLSGRLASMNRGEYGSFSKEFKFNNGWISGSDYRYKIKGFCVEYDVKKPHTEEIVIDGSKELIGVVEYLQKGFKKKVFKNGIIKENNIVS